jgi:hypothetical protein
MFNTRWFAFLACGGLLAACAPGGGQPVDNTSQTLTGGGEGQRPDDDDRRPLKIRHVLLISIDGMHEVDLENLIAANPASTLAKLAGNGVRYTQAFVNTLDGSPTNPTDSFPGLLALATGASSPTHGGWYDVSWTRDLYESTCATQGFLATYDESVENNDAFLWGDVGAGPTHQIDTIRSRINPAVLPHRKQGANCSPVFPHEYIRANTIFEVAHAAGLHTAWSDKHLAYELVSGPSGKGLDDFFAPEINSDPSNSLVPTAPPGGAFTDDWRFTKLYDDVKVQAMINEIDGKWSDDGLPGATDTAGHPGVPAIFGMNFQAVSVAQKAARITAGPDGTLAGPGGYTDALGTPSAELADAIAHTDTSIGRMVAELDAQGLLASTLVIVTAKHGQSPIDHTVVAKVSGDAVASTVDAAAPLAGFSRDPGNGHIEDDVGLYWLADPTTAAAAAAALAPSATLDPRADQIFTTANPAFVTMFGDPTVDPHTPDMVVQPKHGTIYSLSKKKWAEHGGFADDDSHVALLVSNPGLSAATSDAKVRTKQVAPTILEALGLNSERLDGVRKEGTKVLPGLRLGEDD